MKTDFDLSALLRALGVKSAEGKLDLLGLLQPTVTIADLTGMSPAVIPPTSAIGGRANPHAVNFSIIQITTAARGGAYVQFAAGPSPNTFAHWVVVAVPFTLVGPDTLIPQRLGHQAATITGTRGSSVAGITGIGPNFPQLAVGVGHTIYLPRGFTFAMSGQSANQQISLSAIVQDVPADVPADAAIASLP